MGITVSISTIPTWQKWLWDTEARGSPRKARTEPRRPEERVPLRNSVVHLALCMNPLNAPKILVILNGNVKASSYPCFKISTYTCQCLWTLQHRQGDLLEMAEGMETGAFVSAAVPYNGNRETLGWHFYARTIWNKQKLKIWTHVAHTQAVCAPAHSTTCNVRLYWPPLQMGNNQTEAMRDGAKSREYQKQERNASKSQWRTNIPEKIAQRNRWRTETNSTSLT